MRGSYWELMRWLSDFLTEKFGEGGRTKQRWKLRDWDESRHHAEDRERERRGRERE
jgi:dipeptidyl aminopeptidase B